MTHDPYQNYAAFAGYPTWTNAGLANPFSSPYAAMQTSAINPAAYNPLAAGIPTPGIHQQGQGYQAIPGVSPFSSYAQQLQLASQAGLPQVAGMSPFTNLWQNPFVGAFQNPLAVAALQNPFIAAALQNPLAAAAVQLQNPLLNPILAQLASQFGSQIGSQPYSPFQQQHHQQQMGHAAPAFGQQVSPFNQFNSPLAPQSWVGQGVTSQGVMGQGLPGQIGGGYGQANPLLAQLVARALQGGSPWACY